MAIDRLAQPDTLINLEEHPKTYQYLLKDIDKMLNRLLKLLESLINYENLGWLILFNSFKMLTFN